MNSSPLDSILFKWKMSLTNSILFKWKMSLTNSILVPGGQPPTSLMWVPVPLVLHLSHLVSLTHSHFKLPSHSSNFKDSSFPLRLSPSLSPSSNTLQTLSDPLIQHYSLLPIFPLFLHSHLCILGGSAGGYLGPSSWWLHVYHK